MIDLATSAFILLLVVIDPIGLAPLFLALTLGDTEPDRKNTAIKGVFIAGIILIVFTLAGDALLRYLNISTASFSIAGGLLLLLLAMDMILVRQSGLRSTTIREQEEAIHKADISVFPLAIPMIAGPGALTTLLLLTGTPVFRLETAVILAILLIILLLTLFMLLLASKISGFLGETGINVITRILGIILTALAIQYIINGLLVSFPVLTGS
ncbi:MAG: MarC family protein [Gammaproteobacteria bacterium]|nr:MarC family protein [Gammaproteobacteria bacterium]